MHPGALDRRRNRCEPGASVDPSAERVADDASRPGIHCRRRIDQTAKVSFGVEIRVWRTFGTVRDLQTPVVHNMVPSWCAPRVASTMALACAGVRRRDHRQVDPEGGPADVAEPPPEDQP